ncbi:hypothetical protein G6F68_018617 [Rhizopus microsporus]|nr:hypothetical protein G6F68_018617 [Rhizopus microsporus]
MVAMLTPAFVANWSTVALAPHMMSSRMASATLRAVTLNASRRLRIWKTMSRMMFMWGSWIRSGRGKG